MSLVQSSLPGMDHLARRPTATDLLKLAIEREGSIDVIERIAALMREERDHQARVDFDVALNRCQSRIERIAADANNPQTHSRYATYAKLDRILRPIYTSEGFSLSFGEADCPVPGKTRFVAYLSREGQTREYRKDMTASTKGPKGNDVMTPVHAEGALDSYARRYLLKSIFNVAVGEDDADGNEPAEGGMDEAAVKEWLALMKSAESLSDLKDMYGKAYAKAREAGDDQATLAIIGEFERGKKSFAKGDR